MKTFSTSILSLGKIGKIGKIGRIGTIGTIGTIGATRTIGAIGAVAAVLAVLAVLTPRDAQALCNSGTACPAGTATFHKLRLVELFNSNEVSLNGSEQISLGKIGFTSPYLVACVDNIPGGPKIYRVDDMQDGSGINISSLSAESFLCLGPGDDMIFVRSDDNWECGGIRINRFDYGGYPLRLYGQAGKDYLSGGSGQDFLCGGDGSDHLIGGAGSDELDGWRGCDFLEDFSGAGDVFGYEDPDQLVHAVAGGVLWGEGGDYDCLHSGVGTAIADCGGGYDAAWLYPASNVVYCEYQANCFFEYWDHARAACDDL